MWVISFTLCFVFTGYEFMCVSLIPRETIHPVFFLFYAPGFRYMLQGSRTTFCYDSFIGCEYPGFVVTISRWLLSHNRHRNIPGRSFACTHSFILFQAYFSDATRRIQLMKHKYVDTPFGSVFLIPKLIFKTVQKKHHLLLCIKQA